MWLQSPSHGSQSPQAAYKKVLKLKQMATHMAACGLPLPAGLILNGELVPLLGGAPAHFGEWSSLYPIWVTLFLVTIGLATDLLHMYSDTTTKTPARVFFAVDYVRCFFLKDVIEIEPAHLLDLWVRPHDLKTDLRNGSSRAASTYRLQD